MLLLRLLLIPVFVAALDGCGRRSGEPEPFNLSFQVEGEPAPRSLSDFRGRVVALTFWVPSCPQCDSQALVLNNLNARLSREGLICFVLQEQGGAGLLSNLSLIIGTPLPATTGNLPRARPLTLILDRQGRLVHRLEKPVSAEELRKLLDPLLAG